MIHPRPPSLLAIREQTVIKCTDISIFSHPVIFHGPLIRFLFVHSIPLLTDSDVLLDNLDTSLFPGVDSSVEVHDGFSEAHKRCATSPHTRSVL